MSFRPAAVARPVLSALLALLVLLGAAAIPPVARADSAPADPTLPSTPPTVSADSLPTVQINGVVWSQVVVGTTVYVGGDFTRARPAGSPAGQNEVVRNNLLAYDIRTGQLISSFRPDLDDTVLSVAASPDGTRLYVGGYFTRANGQNRYRLAAYDTATGELVTSFQPALGAEVRAIAATNSTVYVGGSGFGSAGGVARGRLAAFNAADGRVTGWVPNADNIVTALLVTGGGTVVVGGHQSTLNGVTACGVGGVDATTGTTTRRWEANTVTANCTSHSAITALAQDGDTVFATGYAWQSGSLEGMIAFDPGTGAVRWVEDCRGDTYSVYATGSVEYTVGHAHNCAHVGGWPQVDSPNDSDWVFRRAVAFGKTATGTNVGNDPKYPWFIGRPAPSLLTWFPELAAGTHTGQYQAAWSVAGTAEYVVLGGEFPSVNGGAQQGLARFAVPTIAPNDLGPDGRQGGLIPTATSWSAGSARLTFGAVSDPDNSDLTYQVFRSDQPGSPIGQITARSDFWNPPTLTFTDRTAPAGQRVTYFVRALDPFGNKLDGPGAAVTISTDTTMGTTPDDYSEAVRGDAPGSYWRLGEAGGRTSYDQAGSADLALGSGVTLGRTGALPGRTNRAAAFDGTSAGTSSTGQAVRAPDVFSTEMWFATTTTRGGKLIGFGGSQTGLSTVYDRHVWMDGNGRVSFGVYDGALNTVASPATGYNDGKWHHVVASMGPAGMALYLDGKLVGSKAGITTGQVYSGYWRVGGDRLWSGANAYLNASLDEVAVYPVALTADQVARHHRTGSSAPGNVAPTAAFTPTVSELSVAVDGSASADADGSVASHAWNFGDGATGTGATASHTYAAAGTYAVTLTVTDDAGATATATRQVTVTAPLAPGTVLAADAFGREVSSGWGSADRGGAWTVPATSASVTGGSGRLTAAPGTGAGAGLGISARDVSVTADVLLEKAATGGGSFVSLGSRSSGGTMYNGQLSFRSDGTVTLSLVAVANWAETALGSYVLPGTYSAGTVLKLRIEAVGTGTTSVRARAWPAGTAEPEAWQLSATDTTAALQDAGGLYVDLYTSKSATAAQTLRVDNLSVTPPGTTSTDPGNVAPTAAFTPTVSELSVAVDGSASADPDGSVASHAWDFGDGATGTGATASHTYAAAGTYAVTLTVTDDAGATATATREVTVTAPAPPPPAGAALAADAFGREVASGWGTADQGGAWTISGAPSDAAVTGGTGRLTAAAGVTTSAALGISARDVAVQADVTLEKAPAGGASFVSLGSRRTASGVYETTLYYTPDGRATLVLSVLAGATQTDLGYHALPGTFAPGTVLTVRMEASGSGTTTLGAKAWAAGTEEPAAWQLTGSDSTPALQTAGGVAVALYTSSKATSAQTVQVDGLWAGAAGTTP